MSKFDDIREAAAHQPHGTRARYVSARCRCVPCRAANSRYQSERLAGKKRGQRNDIVPADAAREHIGKLSAAGVGRRAIAEAAGVNVTNIFRIKSGEKQRIRRQTEARILAVTPESVADGALVDAAPTWKRIRELLQRGYTKRSLAQMFGYESPALQLKTKKIRASNAFRIQALCDEIEAGRIRRV